MERLASPTLFVLRWIRPGGELDDKVRAKQTWGQVSQLPQGIEAWTEPQHVPSLPKERGSSPTLQKQTKPRPAGTELFCIRNRHFPSLYHFLLIPMSLHSSWPRMEGRVRNGRCRGRRGESVPLCGETEADRSRSWRDLERASFTQLTAPPRCPHPQLNQILMATSSLIIK